MASGMYWYRFHIAMHGKGKARALSDAEFRLLTRIWALSRESERPGWVFVVEGVGWSARDLAQTAGCKGGQPEKMLERLVELRWVRVHEGGVIEVHDWEEHNPPPSPSKMPAARAAQKRKERATGKVEGKPVANVSPGDSVSTTQATGQEVGTLELEKETEQETEKASAARPPAPSKPSRARVILGPMGVLFVQHVAHGIGHGLVPLADRDDADRLERAVKRHGGPERASAYIASTCQTRPGWDPQHVKLLVDVLDETAAPAQAGGGA